MLTKKNLTLTKKTNKKSNKKSNKKTNKPKTQKGGLLNKKKPSVYKNISYKKSKTGFSIPELKCPVCKNNLFKLRRMKLATRLKGFLLNTNFFDNTFKEFTCVSCGKVEFYSDRLNFTTSKK